MGRGRRRGIAFILSASALVAGSLVGAVPAFAAAPTISSFTPSSGTIHTVVTITGANFSSPATVGFAGAPGIVATVVSATKLTATVPGTAGTGQITVTTPGGTATSTGSFTVVPGTYLAVASGPPTTATTFTFSGFGAGEAVDVYFDTTDVALVVASSVGAGHVTTTVPASARPGTHTFTAVGRHSGSAAQSSFSVRTDWSQRGFDNVNTGLNPYENLLSPTTAGQLKQLWRTPVGAAVYSSQAVVGGIVYASLGDGSVRSFNATTGAAGWQTTLPGASGTNFSTPAVAGGVVYVGGGADNVVFALNASTGAVKWSFVTGSTVWGSPKVVGGIVYIGSYDDKLYALNATTGALIWSFTAGAAIFGTPAVANGVVYVGAFDGVLYALKATTGVSLWTYTVSSSNILASPVVADGIVYAAAGTNLDAIDSDSGSLVWSATLPGAAEATPALDDGTLFIGDDTSKVSAFDAGDGTLEWSQALSGSPLIQSMTAADGVIYTGNGTTTYALRESDGKRLRTLSTGGFYGGVVIANGMLTMGANNGSSGSRGIITFALPASVTSPAKIPSPAALKPNRQLVAQ